MKAPKIIAIVLVVYVGIVVAFESLLGYFQPANQSTLIITTTDEEGASHDRVVARLRSNDQLYVAANHWPRAWFRQTSTNPAVEIEMDGIRSSYTAVPVAGEEHDRVDDDNSLGFAFRALTGFPPRYFVRLEPR